MRPKVAIGISSAEQSRFALFYASLAQVKRPTGTIEIHARGGNVSGNRNVIAEQAIKAGCTHIWYVDDDQVFEPDVLLQLLAHDRDIVSGLYLSRVPPYLPQVYDKAETDGRCRQYGLRLGDKGLMRAEAVGAGCLLIRTSVLSDLERPWWRLGQIAKDEWCDDIEFFYRLRRLGKYTVWCDLDVHVGHHAPVTIWPERRADGSWHTVLLTDQHE